MLTRHLFLNYLHEVNLISTQTSSVLQMHILFAVSSLFLATSLLATDGEAHAIPRAEAGISEAPGHALFERAPISCNQKRGLEDQVAQVSGSGSKGVAYT